MFSGDLEDLFYRRLTKLRNNKKVSARDMSLSLGQSENYINNEDIELQNVSVESKNDLRKAALNSIYFDVKTQAQDGRIITLDLQRKYIKERIRNRTIYYACREIGAQTVVKSKYKNLKSVIITFLLTEASLKNTGDNKKIQLHDTFTG